MSLLELIAGASVLLAVACVAVLVARRPSTVHALAPLGMAAVLAWLLVAAVPLRRPLAPSTATRASGAVPASAIGPVATGALRPQPLRAQAADHAPPFDVGALLRRAYLAGVLIAAAWLLLGSWRLFRLLRGARPAPPALRDLAFVPPSVRLLVTDVPCRPFSCGVLRPSIVLPRALCAAERREELRHVLRHELAHVARHDSLRSLPFTVALPLLWFHPLYWWLRARSRLASELLADDAAARQSDPATYARHLIALAEHDARALPAPATATTAVRSRSEFYRRMTMLLERKTPLATCSRARRGAHLAGATTLVVLASCLWGTPGATAQRKIAKEKAVTAQDPETATLRADARRLRAKLDEIEDRLARRDPKRSRRAAATATENSARVKAVVVRAGDSLVKIVREHCGDLRYMDEVRVLNPQLDAKRLAVGQVVRVPVVKTAKAGRVVPLASLAQRPASAPTGPAISSVLELATRAIDLDGAIALAENDVARSEALLRAKASSREAVTAARIRLESAVRKREMLRQIIDSEVAASELELADLTKARAGGAAQEARITRLRARVRILRSSR